MEALQKLAQSQPNWLLEEFVDVTNDLLPQFLPDTKGNERVRDEITSRLVRHYTSLGMLDEPLRSGKYAIYTYRHLLQILVVRRLLAEGISASAIDRLATKKDNTELEDLLAGGVQLSISPANPKLAFLQQSQQQNDSVSNSSIVNTSSAPISKLESEKIKTEASHWIRFEVLPGLEIHLHSDFSYPNSPSEQHLLMQYIAQSLQTLSKKKSELSE